MKQVIYSIFCAIGLIGSVNAGVANENCPKTASKEGRVLTNMDDLTEDYSSGWIKDFGNRCRKCGKPK
ncbi:MAG: hypothetical protein JSR39_04105 [Verrucomicrobia bacterium]|nr:hypothetical protein [Verrucomicrobiota bacterium]